MCFIVDVADNDELHMTVAGLPAFRYARYEVTPLIPFHRVVAPPMTGSSIILCAPSLVGTIPDTMPFTRMLSGAYSTASDRVSAFDVPLLHV